MRHHAALNMKHRCSRVAKYEALEGGLVYTGWNMTCSPRANRLYTARERAAGRQQGRGKVARLARIQKSKNSGSWCAKAFYCTKYKYLVKNGGTSGKFWKGYFEKPGPLRDLFCVVKTCYGTCYGIFFPFPESCTHTTLALEQASGKCIV